MTIDDHAKALMAVLNQFVDSAPSPEDRANMLYMLVSAATGLASADIPQAHPAAETLRIVTQRVLDDVVELFQEQQSLPQGTHLDVTVQLKRAEVH